MARTAAVLSEGARVTDYISLGVIAEKVPRSVLDRILQETGKQSRRQRKLPAHVVMYYVIALALFMNVSYGEVLRCLVDALRWLGLPVEDLRRTGKSGISQARSRLGSEPMRRLYEEIATPVAERSTQGAWYRDWRLVSMDGTTLDVADQEENAAAFGRPGASRGASSFPQMRLVALVECGTHVLFGAAQGPCSMGEKTLAQDAVGALKTGMLCSADRGYFSYELWDRSASTGADLLWRLKSNVATDCEEPLEDGSYLTTIYPTSKHRRRRQDGVKIRVIEYALEGIEGTEPVYRLATTILEDQRAPAADLAALYHERWEIENAFDELKAHLRGARIVMRSKTPDLVIQELYGLLIAHYAIRALMHEAAQQAEIDPDALSFVHAVRVIRRHAITIAAFPPSDPGAPRGLGSGGDS
ncbi:MAG: IS4 family transposase [Holophagales bacterium]|nr:IS4 family transposase [Holophagales bacterium]